MFIKHNVLGIIWTIIIIVVCGIPGDNLPESSFWGNLPIDKIVHFGLYYVLFTFCFSGMIKSQFKHAGWLTFIYCIVIGLIVELLQTYYFVGRSGDLYDFIANSIGALFAWFLYGTLARRISFLNNVERKHN